MSIKVRYSPQAAREPEMPALMKHKKNGTVVLARVHVGSTFPPQAPSYPGAPSVPVMHDGVVLYSESNNALIGETVYPLNLSEWTPFTGTLTLEG